MGTFKVYRGKKNSNDVGKVISFNDETGKMTFQQQKFEKIQILFEFCFKIE